MQDYLQRNELLYSYKSGFRATYTCLSQLTDMILNGAENGKYRGMILIDLHMAFVNLDYKILLGKMKCTGFSDKNIKCFYSYLTNRAFLFHWAQSFQKQGP